MEFDRYRETVATNRRKHGFDDVKGTEAGVDELWSTRDEDPTVGRVSLFATVVDGSDHDASDVVADADRFRDVIGGRIDDHRESTTPIGYITFVVPDPSDDVVSAATSYTVAERRTNVFPLVYAGDDGTLHTHPVPRLKGRGIYRRQEGDAERLFDV